jgi:hypothetical protein
MLLDLLIAFLLLGFIEAVAKPIAMRVVKWKIVKYGALAMSFLDSHVKDITDLPPEELEHNLRLYMQAVTGVEWKDEELNEIFRLHDLRLITKSEP